jgi:hypothetical protein
MRFVFVFLLIMAMTGVAPGQDLGPFADRPAKDTVARPYVSPDKHRQGGDTVDDATVIEGLPYFNTGDTTGYSDDYEVMCPYGSWSPDVVYSFTPAQELRIDVDLCGSAYDTKTFIMDSGLTVIACNDDFYFNGHPCGDYVSKMEAVELSAGNTYYIVVDGYAGYFGEYILNVSEHQECFVNCPADAVPEGEPALHDGYEDQYNSGCGAHPPVYQYIDWTNDEDGVPPYDGQAWLCAKSGWFQSPDGFDTRDTDWFIVYALETGLMEVTAESEYPLYLFKLAPTDCAEVGAELQATADCELPGTLSFPVTAGEEIWLWTGPTTFTGPVTEFTYFMTVTNNMFDVVPADEMSFGGVKALYR